VAFVEMPTPLSCGGRGGGICTQATVFVVKSKLYENEVTVYDNVMDIEHENKRVTTILQFCFRE